MEKIREKLRLRFQAETDIEIGPGSRDWNKYAEWLEGLAVIEITEGLVKENDMMRRKMIEAIRILEKGIAGCYTKGIDTR